MYNPSNHDHGKDKKNFIGDMKVDGSERHNQITKYHSKARVHIKLTEDISTKV